MSIPAALLRELATDIAVGPAGMGIGMKPTGVNADGTAAAYEIDDQALNRAKAQNDGGVNKPFAKEMPQPKGAQKALATHAQHQNHNLARLERVMGHSGAWRRMGYQNLKSMSANGPAPSAPSAQPPSLVQRIQKRHYLAVRRTLDELMKRKTVALSPQAKARITETSLRNGDRATPFGAALPQPQPQSGSKRRKPRQWAMINTELIPSGFAMD